VIGIVRIRALDTDVTENKVCVREHHPERGSEPPQAGEGRCPCICPLCTGLCHLAPPSGSNPGHCQQVQTPEVIYCKKTLRSAAKFSRVFSVDRFILVLSQPQP